jgi:hypothetical protein
MKNSNLKILSYTRDCFLQNKILLNLDDWNSLVYNTPIWYVSNHIDHINHITDNDNQNIIPIAAFISSQNETTITIRPLFYSSLDLTNRILNKTSIKEIWVVKPVDIATDVNHQDSVTERGSNDTQITITPIIFRQSHINDNPWHEENNAVFINTTFILTFTACLIIVSVIIFVNLTRGNATS